jgi:hypothetical protein
LTLATAPVPPEAFKLPKLIDVPEVAPEIMFTLPLFPVPVPPVLIVTAVGVVIAPALASLPENANKLTTPPDTLVVVGNVENPLTPLKLICPPVADVPVMLIADDAVPAPPVYVTPARTFIPPPSVLTAEPL